MEDFDLLIKEGTIGFYQSCEITEIFMFPKDNNDFISNLFTLVTFEEKTFRGIEEKNITDKLIDFKYISDGKKLDYKIGIRQYHLDLKSIEKRFYKLKNEEKWVSISSQSIDYPFLKYLTKQFIPSDENISNRNHKLRLNNCLKNNFFNGSYILEFFEEYKQKLNFLIEDDSKFEMLSNQIKSYIPINLYVNRDRLGNFIFQFPINLCKIDYYKEDENLIRFDFFWNHKLDSIPDCYIETESLLNDCIFDFSIEEYNKSNMQLLNLNNLDSLLNFKIFRKDNNLLLFSSKGNFINNFLVKMNIDTFKQRYFSFNDGLGLIEGKINILSKDLELYNKNLEYYEYIHRSQNIVEKEELIKNLRFKPYNSNLNNYNDDAIKDLIDLIQKNCSNGVYLWDPYLSPKDIISILFFVQIQDVPLRALGSINKNVSNIYKNQHLLLNDSLKQIVFSSKNAEKKVEKLKEKFSNFDDCYSHVNYEKIREYKNQFELIKGNFKEGLNLEFKVRMPNYGWTFHDRFIIFPGNPKNFESPKAYSLGKSINSFGKDFHIIQEVSHPQAILDEFNKLWDELGEECVVWKYPS